MQILLRYVDDNSPNSTSTLDDREASERALRSRTKNKCSKKNEHGNNSSSLRQTFFLALYVLLVVLTLAFFLEMGGIELLLPTIVDINRKKSAMVFTGSNVDGEDNAQSTSVLLSSVVDNPVFMSEGRDGHDGHGVHFKGDNDEKDRAHDYGYDYRSLNAILKTSATMTSLQRQQTRRIHPGKVPEILTTRADIQNRINRNSNSQIQILSRSKGAQQLIETPNERFGRDKQGNQSLEHNSTSPANANGPIRKIALLGERNSGTTWITAHLRECFGHAIKISVTLVRHKHWFQHDVFPKRRVNRTVVVSLFRNPCTWSEAMRAKSYRSPLHYKIKDWRTFVTTPWTMPRLDHDLELWKEHSINRTFAANASAIECQKDYTYNQINACVEKPYLDGYVFQKRAEKRANRKPHKYGDSRDERSGQEPFYELKNDGSGRPYASVMDMRADKILNFLEIYLWDWIEAVLPIKYEDMVKLGTSKLIQNVQKLTGIEAKCNPLPPQNRTPRHLPIDLEKWMTKYVDWEIESLIGYDRC